MGVRVRGPQDPVRRFKNGDFPEGVRRAQGSGGVPPLSHRLQAEFSSSFYDKKDQSAPRHPPSGEESVAPR